MNAKKAKQLRKLTRSFTDGTPSALPDLRYVENKERRKYQDVEKVSGDGKSTYTDKVAIAAGTVTVDGQSRRGIYRLLKKRVKRSGTVAP